MFSPLRSALGFQMTRWRHQTNCMTLAQRCIATNSNHNVQAKMQSNISENKEPIKVSEKLSQDVDASTTVDGVLKIVESRSNMTSREATLITRKLSQLQPVWSSLENDTRFSRVSDIIDREVTSLPPGVLINSLSWLLEICPDDTHLVQSLETQLRWLVTKELTISMLFQILQLHYKHQETELRQQVYLETLDVLEKRWVEISNPKHIVSLMYMVGDDKVKFREHLEEKALRCCEEMKPKDLYKVLYILSKHKRRIGPLSKAALYHLKRQKLELNPVQMSNLLYACANLNIYDMEFLKVITQDIINEIDAGKIDISLLTSMLKSFSNLRWLNKELYQAVWKAMTFDLNKSSDLDLTCLLLTLANVNYFPEEPEKSDLKDIISKCSNLEETNPRLWLDVVWSLAVLQKAENKLLSSVLNPDFYSKFSDLSAEQLVPIQLKLLNVNMVARNEVGGYDGPLLQDENKQKWNTQVPTKSEQPFKKDVIKVLSSMAPNKYWRQDVPLDSGALIDVEMIVNEKGEPQVISDYESLTEPAKGDKKPLPPNFHRLAFKLLDYSDMTLGTGQPTGLNAMVGRHLELYGYTVIWIPFTKFGSKNNVVKKVQNIQGLIKYSISQKSR